ncbi:MAG: TPM domain-containing protein, partial [Syntrophales bacterium]
MAPVLRSRTTHLPILLLLGLLFLIPAAPGRGEFPKPVGTVNDFAQVIGPEESRRIDALSREVLEKTGASVVVATFATLGEAEINDTVNGLYQAWGIGKQGEDRGVLIFLALKERKIRIETGYGVEGILPDGRVGEILDRHVVPFLRAGD